MADSKPKLVNPDAGSTVATPPDPFDLSSLRLKPSFLETAGVKKLTTTVPVIAASSEVRDCIRLRMTSPSVYCPVLRNGSAISSRTVQKATRGPSA